MEKNEGINSMIADLNIEEIKTFVGKKSGYYIKKWSNSKDVNIFAGWNWAAFLAGIFWFGYRKMYSILFYIFGAFLITDLIQALLKVDINKSIGSTTTFVLGFMGNAFYFKHMRNKINKIKRESSSSEVVENKIQEAGETSWAGVGIAVLLFVGYLVISTLIDYVVAMFG